MVFSTYAIVIVFFLLSKQDHHHIQEPFLCAMDSRAVNHVLSHPYDYHKPEVARYNLSQIVGAGDYAVSVVYLK